MTALKLVTGTVTFNHPSLPTPCKTWYKIAGDLTSSASGRPLVVLHGGPGMAHNYLLPLIGLATKYRIPVIFYDQIGGGLSTHYREKRLDNDFWTCNLFIAELDNLLLHLGVASHFDLLGQSWGGMLAAMFAIRGHPGLNRLILSNSPASMPLMVESCNQWRSQLPPSIKDALSRHEADQSYEDPEYVNAVVYFYTLHLCRVVPFPKNLTDTMAYVEEDDTVYRTMNGPSEFTIIGGLKDWTIVDQIHKIKNETLLLSAEFDEVNDSCIDPFFAGIDKVKWYKFANASHCTMLEIPDEYNRVVAGFLLR